MRKGVKNKETGLMNNNATEKGFRSRFGQKSEAFQAA